MSRRKLPLESQYWWPLRKALEHRTQQTGSDVLTRCDFNDALKAGRLWAKVRRVDGTSEVLAASAWEDLHIHPLIQLNTKPFGRGRPRPGELTVWSNQLGGRIQGQWFYVWLPDYKNIFGDPQAISSPPAQMQEVPEKRGRKASHPWPEIGFALVRRMAKKGKSAGNKSTNSWARELADWCEDRYQKAPADSDLRDFIDDVLRALRIERK